MGFFDDISDFGGKVGDFLGGSSSRSLSVPTEVPGLFSRTEGQGFAREAIGQTRQPLRFDDILQGRFRDRQRPSDLRQNITKRLLSSSGVLPSPGGFDILGRPGGFDAPGRPGGISTFGGQLSSSEQALIDQIFAQRQGTFNALGIGSAPGSQAAIAAAAAPALIGLRQQDIENQLAERSQDIGLRGQDIESLLGQRSQDIGLRGQDIESLLGQRSQDIGLRGQDITQQQQQIENLLSAEQQFSQTDLADIESILGAQRVGLGGRELDINTLLSAAGLGETRVGQTSTSKGGSAGFFDVLGKAKGAAEGAASIAALFA